MFQAFPYDFAIASSRISHFFGGLTGITYLSFVVSFLATETGKKANVRLFDYAFAIFNSVMCFTPWMIKEVPTKMFFPYYPEPGVLYPLYIVNFFSPFLIAYFLLYKAYRDQTLSLIQRKQILMALGGVLIAWTGVSNLFLLIYNIQITPISLVLLPSICIFFAYSIIRYRFLDIDVVIRKSLVYSVLVAIITAVYFCVVLLTEKWFQGMVGYRSFVTSVVAGFAIALGFTPLKEFVQRVVDQFFFRGSVGSLAQENERLRQEVTRAERLKAVGTLTAGMAHEIKNPLTAIKTFTEFLPERYDDPEFREKFHP
jgi:signal transduction histidine kinase